MHVRSDPFNTLSDFELQGCTPNPSKRNPPRPGKAGWAERDEGEVYWLPSMPFGTVAPPFPLVLLLFAVAMVPPAVMAKPVPLL